VNILFKTIDQLTSETLNNCREKFVKYLTISKTSTILMMSFVEDILDLGRMESETFTVNYSNIMLMKLLDDINSLFKF